MLRPLPNLNDSGAMSALGRMYALRNARLDAVHALRDAVVRLQSAQCPDEPEIAAAREALSRIEELGRLDAAREAPDARTHTSASGSQPHSASK